MVFLKPLLSNLPVPFPRGSHCYWVSRQLSVSHFWAFPIHRGPRPRAPAGSPKPCPAAQSSFEPQFSLPCVQVTQAFLPAWPRDLCPSVVCPSPESSPPSLVQLSSSGPCFIQLPQRGLSDFSQWSLSLWPHFLWSIFSTCGYRFIWVTLFNVCLQLTWTFSEGRDFSIPDRWQWGVQHWFTEGRM